MASRSPAAARLSAAILAMAMLASSWGDAAAVATVTVRGGGEAEGASIEIAEDALAAVGPVTLDTPAELPIFPGVTVVRAVPAVELANGATVRVPYSERFLETWQIADESALALYELDADGLWSRIPASIDVDANVAVARVRRLTTWAAGPAGLLTAWQSRLLVGAGFSEHGRNALVIHGWNGSPWDACQLGLMEAMASSYDHVIAYAYPSALDIEDNARWLRDALAETDGPFDMIAFSEGGLVARAVLEEEDGEELARRIGRLITVATPHLGLLPDVPESFLGDAASAQMQEGSAFLGALNARPRAGVPYYAIAGDGAGGSDGLVAVESAMGRGVVPLEGEAVLSLRHAPSAAGPGMPCDSAVYETIRAWTAP